MGVYVANGVSIYQTYQVFVRGSKSQGVAPRWVMAGHTDDPTNVRTIIRCSGGGATIKVYDVSMNIDGMDAGIVDTFDVTDQFSEGRT